MPYDTQTDLQLLEELKNGRDAALNEIIERWEKPLTRFAWRYVQNETDARDLVQEAFVKVYKNRNRFRPNTRLSAWMFTTLANQCRNFGRWKKRHPTVALLNMSDEGDQDTRFGVYIDPVEPSSSPDQTAETQDMVYLLRESVSRLPHDLKTTLLLYQYEGLSYKEISDILGCTPKGVETRLYRTRKKLRRILETKMGERERTTPFKDRAVS
ncbi:MAG: RNA polymerase sigma factor [Verrucomicrobia bacterium]|nr:RNA polymerase sigma factor [Verrucomicrobiota bacterium]MDA1068910.1 RNA polymerase sigma factor [Verrucomicrobiota bacterium]